jgi:transcription termination factor NusB
VELAKKFSTAKSGAFINGVLSAVATADMNIKATEVDVESEDFEQ